MAIQKSVVILKPDAVRRHLIGEIISRFEKRGLKVLELEYTEAQPDLVSAHYPIHDRNYVLTLGHVDITGKEEEELEQILKKNSKIVQNLQDYLTEGPIVKMILEGENAVELIREIVGKTDPAKSPQGSIRGDLGEDSYEKSDKEERAVKNLVHASGSPEEAEAEIKLWFPEHKID